MAWIVLGCAGVLEIVWAVATKQSEGFTRLVPTLVSLVTMVASFALLAHAMKTLPLGTAYAVVTGIGAAGALVIGILAFGESASATRMLAVSLIVAGIILLKVSEPS